MTGGEESHHLIDEVFLGEPTGFESYGKDVDVDSFLLLVELVFLFAYKFTADFLDCVGRFYDFVVVRYRQRTQKPLRQEQTQESHHPLLAGWREDGAVRDIDFSVWVVDCIKFMTHLRDFWVSMPFLCVLRRETF